MEPNEKELMDALKDIVDNASSDLTDKSREEMASMSSQLADAFSEQIEPEVRTAVFGVTVLSDEQRREAKERWKSGDSHTLKSPFVNSIDDDDAKCAKVEGIIQGIPQEAVLDFFDDFDGMMLLEGWLQPQGLIAFVRYDDGSTFQVFTTQDYVQTTRTLATGDKVSRNYKVGTDTPDFDDLNEYETDLVRGIHVALAMPKMIKAESEALYDTMLLAIQTKMERKMRAQED